MGNFETRLYLVGGSSVPRFQPTGSHGLSRACGPRSGSGYAPRSARKAAAGRRADYGMETS
eukprot:336604-Prymnesium_polylepis.1